MALWHCCLGRSSWISTTILEKAPSFTTRPLDEANANHKKMIGQNIFVMWTKCFVEFKLHKNCRFCFTVCWFGFSFLGNFNVFPLRMSLCNCVRWPMDFPRASISITFFDGVGVSCVDRRFTIAHPVDNACRQVKKKFLYKVTKNGPKIGSNVDY